MTEKKPVLVQVQADQVCVLQLGPKNEHGVHPLPFEPYRRVGDVVSLTERVPDLRRKGNPNAMRMKTSWFAYLVTEQRLGPFTSSTKAIAALLDQLGLVQVKTTATMEPLF